MENISFREHAANALYIVKDNSIVLWYIGLLSLISGVNLLFPEGPLHNFVNGFVLVMSVLATPVIYGIYFELIEDSYSSIEAIFKKYFLRYLWLLLRMYVPVTFVAMTPYLANPQLDNLAAFQVVVVSFSLLFLYVIPLFYVTDKVMGSITGGVQFLLQNITVSTPVILLTLLTEAGLLLFGESKALLSSHTVLAAAMEFGVYMAANIIDFVLFMVLIFLLKTQKSTAQE